MLTTRWKLFLDATVLETFLPKIFYTFLIMGLTDRKAHGNVNVNKQLFTGWGTGLW